MDEKTYNIHKEKDKRNEHTCLYLFCPTSKIPIRNFVLLWPRRKKNISKKDRKTKRTERQIDRHYFEEIILEI